MADAMVTGRMTSAKKEAGNRVLDKLGINASQAINQLYDHLIEKGSMPFEGPQKDAYTKAQVEEALAYARSLRAPNAFSRMTDDEIRRHKMTRGHGIDVPEA